MTQSTSQTRKTAPQRKAALRRALGTAAVAVALVGLLALPSAAEAQTRGGDPEQRVERLDEALDLTDAQAAELLALFEAQAATRPARSSERPDRAEMRAERQARRTEMDRRIAAVLTPAQLERYQALQAERGQRPGRRGDGR